MINFDLGKLSKSATSITDGVSSLLDVGGHLRGYKTTIDGNREDEKALSNDWLVVGADLSSAMKAFEKESSL